MNQALYASIPISVTMGFFATTGTTNGAVRIAKRSGAACLPPQTGGNNKPVFLIQLNTLQQRMNWAISNYSRMFFMRFSREMFYLGAEEDWRR
jgi:hypothetical protein